MVSRVADLLDGKYVDDLTSSRIASKIRLVVPFVFEVLERAEHTTAALFVCRYEGMMLAVMLGNSLPTLVPPNSRTSHGLGVVCGIVEEVK